MSQLSTHARRRNLLIGGGIAAVAALFAVLYVTDSPPGMQNAVGTIVPAERYRATAKAGPSGDVPARATRRKVNDYGAVRYSGWRIQVSRRWTGLVVDIREHAR